MMTIYGRNPQDSRDRDFCVSLGNGVIYNVWTYAIFFLVVIVFYLYAVDVVLESFSVVGLQMEGRSVLILETGRNRETLSGAAEIIAASPSSICET